MGMLQIELTSIVVEASKSCIVNRQFGVQKLSRVVLGDPLCTGHVILRSRSELCSLHKGINAIFANNMVSS